MHSKIMVAGLLVLGLLVVPALKAGEREKDRGPMRASNLTGMYVKNGTTDDAQTLGHIEDIVFDVNGGNIVYYVLARNQVLGLGGNYFAIAPETLKMSGDADYFILSNVTNEQLEDAKGFDSNAWPTEPDRRWSKGQGKVEKGVREAGEDVKETVKGKKRLARVESVFGMAVRNHKNESLGSIYDLAVDMHNQKITYAAVSTGGTLGIGGRLVAVPLNKMALDTAPTARASSRVFLINTTPEQFEQAPGFTSNENWPARANDNFWSKVRTGGEEQRNNDNDR